RDACRLLRGSRLIVLAGNPAGRRKAAAIGGCIPERHSGGMGRSRCKELSMIHEYAAIDTMALLFPSRIYISMSEKRPPHVPKSIEIKEAVGRLTPEERLYILQRARVMATYSKAVEEAVAGMKS